MVQFKPARTKVEWRSIGKWAGSGPICMFETRETSICVSTLDKQAVVMKITGGKLKQQIKGAFGVSRENWTK